MASWQAKQRNPLFDQSTQAALERRGKEVVGAALVVLGALIALMLLSHSPDDPSFQSATDAPAQNLLGGIGAYVSSALFMITGYGSYMLAVGAVGWGLRLMLHRGEDRLVRAVFLPIAMVLLSIYATSIVPPPGWRESFGLGGHLGDMLMGAMLGLVPLKASIAIKILALLTAVATVAFSAFVLGFSRAEVTAIGRFLQNGLRLALHLFLQAVRWGARAAAGAARAIRGRVEARRARIAG
uniref:DNA translocase FtsK 4TM domain-containing protein n=1 Tax=Paracoccus aeridis TaxID=1966466 RepID=UPI00113DAEEA